jgi:hypothetical protein
MYLRGGRRVDQSDLLHQAGAAKIERGAAPLSAGDGSSF